VSVFVSSLMLCRVMLLYLLRVIRLMMMLSS